MTPRTQTWTCVGLDGLVHTTALFPGMRCHVPARGGMTYDVRVVTCWACIADENRYAQHK